MADNGNKWAPANPRNPSQGSGDGGGHRGSVALHGAFLESRAQTAAGHPARCQPAHPIAHQSKSYEVWGISCRRRRA